MCLFPVKIATSTHDIMLKSRKQLISRIQIFFFALVYYVNFLECYPMRVFPKISCLFDENFLPVFHVPKRRTLFQMAISNS